MSRREPICLILTRLFSCGMPPTGVLLCLWRIIFADWAVLCRRFIKVSDSYDGTNFWVTMPNGQKSATPLLLALAVIEISDVVFAVDSIPAVCPYDRHERCMHF